LPFAAVRLSEGANNHRTRPFPCRTQRLPRSPHWRKSCG
jgi:hypothetical protein